MADDIRVRAIGKSISPQEPDLPVHTEALPVPEEVTCITSLSLSRNYKYEQQWKLGKFFLVCL